MAAPAAALPLVEIQLIAQAGDTAAMVARRPVLLDGDSDVVKQMNILSGRFLRWDTAPDGRRRVPALGDFLSAFCSASVFDAAAREQPLDLRTMELGQLIGRVAHLIATGSLQVQAYSTRRRLVKALRAGAFQRRADAQMQCTALSGFTQCEEYQAAAPAPPAGADGEGGAVAPPAVVIDNLLEAEYMREGVFEDGLDDFGIPDALPDYYYYFGATITRAMRINADGQFRTMAFTVLNTLAKAQLVPVGAAERGVEYSNPMALSAVLQWLRDNVFPLEFDFSSLQDRTTQRAMHIQNVVLYFSGSEKVETVLARSFRAISSQLSTLGTSRWLKELSGPEAYAQYCRLAKTYFPDENASLWNTMELTDKAVAGDSATWNKPSLDGRTGAALVSELVRLRLSNEEVVRGTAKKGAAGDQATGGGDSLNATELKISMQQISSASFEKHANRIKAVEDSTLSPELKSLAVLHAALGVPRMPSGVVDESVFHILIPQNVIKPRLSIVHHWVFGILDKYKDQLDRYLSQYAMFGDDLGASAENAQHKMILLDAEALKSVKTGGWEEPDYLNEFECRLQALLDECEGEPYDTKMQYITKANIDDLQKRLFWTHESLGIDPHMEGSTQYFLDEQKKIIQACRNYPAHRRQRIDALIQESFLTVLQHSGAHWYGQMISKDPTLKMNRCLGAACKAIYDATLGTIRDLLSTMRPMLRLDPDLLGVGDPLTPLPASCFAMSVCLRTDHL